MPNHPLTPKQLLLSMEISDKTLRSMVRSINAELSVYKAEIVIKRGLGYTLETSDKSVIRLALKEVVSAQKAYVIEVFHYMINLREFITMDRLCEELYISKSKLNNALAELKTLMEPFGLKLRSKPHHGMIIEGEELGKRLGIASILKADSYVKSDKYDFVEKVVVDEFHNRNVHCSDLMLKHLISHVQIMLERSLNGHIIDLNPNVTFNNTTHQALTEAIWNQLEQQLDTNLPEAEKSSLYSYIVGQVNSIDQEELEDIKLKIGMIIDAFLQKIEKMYDVFLWEDTQLRSGLQFHLEPLLIRLNNEIHHKNPILKEIKQQFPFAFNLGVLFAEEVHKICHKALTEDEIAYLTMHIGLALERDVQHSRKIFDRIAIVCSTGQGTAELLKFKIQHSFPNTHYIKSFSMFNKKDILQFEPDIIFSMVPIQVGNLAVEVISPFFTEEDKNKLLSYQKRKDKERLINRYFSEDLFNGSLEAGTKQSAIHQICARIDRTGITPPEFEQLCLIRENLASTAFGNLIALVHPIELCSVVTKVGVGILNKQIDWAGAPVKVVFVIAQAKSNEARDLLLLIQEVVHNANLMLHLCEAQTFSEFREILLQS